MVEGDAIVRDRRASRDIGSRSSMPRYLYRSVCACASARFPDEDDRSDDDHGCVGYMSYQICVCIKAVLTGILARQTRRNDAVQ